MRDATFTEGAEEGDTRSADELSHGKHQAGMLLRLSNEPVSLHVRVVGRPGCEADAQQQDGRVGRQSVVVKVKASMSDLVTRTTSTNFSGALSSLFSLLIFSHFPSFPHPKTRYRGRYFPITPATTGPRCRPTLAESVASDALADAEDAVHTRTSAAPAFEGTQEKEGRGGSTLLVVVHALKRGCGKKSIRAFERSRD